MERDPAREIERAVEDVLTEAATWFAWDGRPRANEGSVWTPLKALRRVTDHLIDHLAQTEAVLSGEPPLPDTWKGRYATLASEWAPFTEADLREAEARLRRLAAVYAARLHAAGVERWDADRGDEWTLRRIAEHCAGSLAWYAGQPMGRDIPMPD
jgi:hypothetical protein